MSWKRWTEEEVAQALRLFRRRWTYQRIAERLGRNVSSVGHVIRREDLRAEARLVAREEQRRGD